MKDNGGPAFPGMSFDTDSSGALCSIRGMNEGMTLRDYFAGQALAGGADIPKMAAKYAYDVADAMLAEREARP